MPISSWKLPPAPLRASAVTAQLVGLLLVSALAWSARLGLGVSPAYPLRAATVFVLVMLVAMGGLEAHHPFARLGPANHITTWRAALVALVAALALEPPAPQFALAASVVAGVTAALDGADGWTARRTRMASAFGARFDMEVDALLVLVLSVLVWRAGLAGAWVLAIGAMRYGFVAAGAASPWLREPLPPSRRRQVVCVLQIATLSVVLVPALSELASACLAAALLVLTLSFGIDIRWLWRRRAGVPRVVAVA